MVLLEHPEFIETFGFGPGSEPKDLNLKIVFFSGAFLFVLGHLFLGSALLRAKIFKSTPVWFVIAGAVMVGVWPLLPNIVQMLSVLVSLVYAIGIVWLGILLIAGAGLFIIFHENSKNRKNETIIGNQTI